MKKLLFTVLLILALLNAFSQEFMFSAPSGKQGKIIFSSGNVVDNKLTLNIEVKWLDKKLKKEENTGAQIAFNIKDIKYLNAGTVICETCQDLKTDKLYFNTSQDLVFALTEDTKLTDGKLIIDIPLRYAENVQKAIDENNWEKFIVTSPRDIKAKCFVGNGVIKDITPPEILVLSPENVMDGFRPTIYTKEMEVKVEVKERNKIAEVLVNNVNAIESAGNTYLAKVYFALLGGSFPVNISATDAAGNKGEYQFFVETRSPEGLTPLATVTKSEMISDVDTMIPKTGRVSEDRFALIIGNEDYKTYQQGLNYESNVEFARRDAEIFKQYAMYTLGIKEQNIIFMTDAKAVEMHRGLNQLSNLIKATHGNGEAIVYFAGHGFPDEKTKEPYIIPVDVSGNDLEFGIKLKDMYARLYEYPSKRITVFLDACFSGGGRDQGLVAARGVRIRPKNEFIKGNVMVFSASSGNESALPYRDKFHGMYTYYLLKALQNSKGDITMKELTDYVTKKVSTSCILQNNKEQTPTLNVSPDLQENWQEKRLTE